jgi:hypothetical protein
MGDEFASMLELVRTPALNREIETIEGPLRVQCIACAQLLEMISPDLEHVREVRDVLITGARVVQAEYPCTDQDSHDLAHAAEAAASGLNVLVTRDQHLKRVLGPAAAKYGLRFLSPVEVIVRIDELVHAEAYRPVELVRTTYSERRLGVGETQGLQTLANTGGGERPAQWTSLLSSLAIAGKDRFGVYDAAGEVVAAYCVWSADGVLDVPMLRVTSKPIGDTIARQLLFQLRQRARSVQASLIRIGDQHLPRRVRLAALDDGFGESGDHLYALILDVAACSDRVEHVAALAARRGGLPEPSSLRSTMHVAVAAELERTWWPVKILDALLPTYIIPIQQAYSADLLGIPNGLLPRSDTLGLNREHVYYKRPGGTQVHAPGRLLWYMSQGGRSAHEPSAIVACSQLESVMTGTVDDLHSRYQHLGVWDRRTIAASERDGKVQALRFINTEIFPSPVERTRIEQLARENGSTGQPPTGPLPIPPEFFAALYAEGRS